MREAIHEAVDRARLLLLAVALLWGCVPTAHALRSPTPLPSLGWSQPGQQLKEETAPFQKTPLFETAALTLENGPLTAKSGTRSLGPFGRLTGKWGPLADANAMQFSSMPVHRQSGLSLYPFRAYDPNLQRWLNRDPSGEAGGINLYGFNFNNPLSYIDPDGMAPQVVTASYNLTSGGTSVGYADSQFGQGYGIGLHGPLGPGGEIALTTGGTMVPGVGEAMDLSVLADPESRWWELGLAGASLGLNALTEGLLPNAGGFLKAGKKLCKDATGDMIRIRHYTNSKGLKGIEEAGVIRASDQNRVFAESARRKPLSQVEAEDTYRLKPGRGRNYVETDVPADRVRQRYNPKTGATELVVEGDLPLQNPTFERR